ncbi:MAG: NAD-dependent epimerase/dehydratase family protein [Pseudomonadota bacterium]
MTRNIALVGAGFIADAHIKALKRRKDVRIAYIVDVDRSKAQARADMLGGAQAFESVGALLSSHRPDAAHVMTPPSDHGATAKPFLREGIPVLLEKPMAPSTDECRELREAATQGRARLAVNHNFVHHPGFIRARRILAEGTVGPLRSVEVRYAMPLRQLTARQFGHWMFNNPRNLLLEQAVHPLSQIDMLLSGITEHQAVPIRSHDYRLTTPLYTEWSFQLTGSKAFAHLMIKLGARFPSWALALHCDDGVIDVDILENTVTIGRPYAEIPQLDFPRRNFSASVQHFRDGLAGVGAFAGEILRLTPPADGFSRSMQNAIDSFYDNENAEPAQRVENAMRLVGICEAAAHQTPEPTAPARTPTKPDSGAAYDVAVLGGTGFIGRHLVKQLRAQGVRVAVFARNAANLPTIYHGEGIGVFEGSITDEKAVGKVIRTAPKVINLAHGGGGARDEIASTMVNGALNAKRMAHETGVERLIHISSSAALYLGDPADTITSGTTPDPLPERRGDYARAKILTENALAKTDGPPTLILRPAIVVGDGGDPFHSALGAFENETHCSGWSQGKNPLPFVLVEDVAAAIIAALNVPLNDVAGHAFNLVGDIRWTARQYMLALRKATARPLQFHPTSTWRLFATESAKYAAKTIAGRKDNLSPSWRDLKSRGMAATFDTQTEKKVLNWRPCENEKEFHRKAIEINQAAP